MKKIFLLICAAMLMVGCGNESPPAKVTENIPPKEIVHEGKIDLSDALPIMSPMSGNVMEVYFVNGTDVESGQVLFKVDDMGPYTDYLQAKKELAQSMTALAKETSDLQQNYSSEKQAAVDARQEEIAQRKELVQKFETAAAGGMVYAPKPGRIISDVRLGEAVVANESTLAHIGNINPLTVRFEVSAEEKQRIEAAKNLKVSLRFDNGKVYSAEGTLRFVNDLTAEASFDNSEGILLHGMTVSIVISE